MLEILVRGRGGQGAVTAAKLLAIAAFHEGKEVQAFPLFGIERRGAPASAFVRIDDKPILLRSQIYKPNYAIVLDPSLVEALKLPKCQIIVNSTLKKKNVFTFDATSLALKTFGKDIVNSAMIAVFCCVTCFISLESLIRACHELFPVVDAEKNSGIIKEVFKTLKK